MYEEVVKQLLAKDGVNPDFKDKGNGTPLSWAAENGHETVVKLLLAKKGVDPDFKDKDNRTKLLWAAENWHEALVKPSSYARQACSADFRSSSFSSSNFGSLDSKFPLRIAAIL